MNKVTLIGFLSRLCGACAIQEPILNELAINMGDRADIIKVDIVDNRDIAKAWNITATPTLIILKDDQIFKKYIGVTYRTELESAINGVYQYFM